MGTSLTVVVGVLMCGQRETGGEKTNFEEGTNGLGGCGTTTSCNSRFRLYGLGTVGSDREGSWVFKLKKGP